jgi:aryl-alcohol dehydrogenase-like predicted oxidoreductase
MQQRQLGRTGTLVSRLALGTMTWGGDTDEHEARDQLAAFVEAGGNLVDTANTYTSGRYEEINGSLLGDVVPRDAVVLATKAASVVESERRTDASRRQLLTALEASLRRLRTDHIDLWQMHAWDWLTPVEETLSALDAAVASGKVRYVGVSNYSGWQTAKAAVWQAAVPGRAPIVSTQMEYSLLQRGIEREVIPAAIDAGLAVLPWSPLARGVLTGKYRAGTPSDSRGASPQYSKFVAPYLGAEATRVVDAVVTAAAGLDVSPLEIALSWVRDQPGVLAPIVGARTAAQLKAALAVEALTLPAEIRSALDEVSEPAKGYPEHGWAQRR